MVTIPNEIYEAARQAGMQNAEVATWFKGQMALLGVPAETSPAEWPKDLWETYKVLREAHEPGACGGSAKRLFENLDLPHVDSR